MRPLDAPAPAAAPARQRSQGEVRLSLAARGGATGLDGLAESGPLRLRLPAPHGGPFEGVLLNTAGGIACGDTFRIATTSGPETRAVLTTTAAEKIYRSDGPTTVLSVDLTLGARARLAWLPQETILFDEARLERRLTVAMAADAHLTLFEAIAFGRAARGERIRAGRLVDAWRIHRAGRLAYADTLRLEGPISDLLDRPTLGGGNAALATLLHLAPDAQMRLEEARAALAEGTDLPCEAAASAWNGLLAVRFLAPTIGPLRVAAARFLARFRGEPMPRVWQT